MLTKLARKSRAQKKRVLYTPSIPGYEDYDQDVNGY